MPCIITPPCEGEIENAHVQGGGTSRKADASKIVPLCRYHHRVLHRIGVESFEKRFRVALSYQAQKVAALWWGKITFEGGSSTGRAKSNDR